MTKQDNAMQSKEKKSSMVTMGYNRAKAMYWQFMMVKINAIEKEQVIGCLFLAICRSDIDSLLPRNFKAILFYFK
jgi:hypothetical protein